MCNDRFATKIHPRASRGCKVRGEPGSHHRPSRRCRIRGDPKTQGRQSRRVREPRQLGKPPAGAEGERIRGNPETLAQGKAGRCGMRGNPQPHREAQLEELCPGETRSSSARSGEGREIRGNSKIRCRHSRKMREPGKPGDSSAGAIGRAKLWGNPELERRMR